MILLRLEIRKCIAECAWSGYIYDGEYTLSIFVSWIEYRAYVEDEIIKLHPSDNRILWY